MTIDGPSVGWGTTDDNSDPGVLQGYNSSNPTDFFFPNNGKGGEAAVQMEVASVPKPATWAMMLASFAGLGWLPRRRFAPAARSKPQTAWGARSLLPGRGRSLVGKHNARGAGATAPVAGRVSSDRGQKREGGSATSLQSVIAERPTNGGGSFPSSSP